MNAYLSGGAVNDEASAVRVRGEDCKVTMFEHADFSGWHAGPFDEGDYDLSYLEENGFVNDEMSSLKVERRPDVPVPDFGGPDCTVIVYQDADFTGWQVAFGEGDHDYKDFVNAGAFNDDASAVRVRGQDCKAELFQDKGFGGWGTKTLDEGDYDLGMLEDEGFVNDDMSSLKVWH